MFAITVSCRDRSVRSAACALLLIAAFVPRVAFGSETEFRPTAGVQGGERSLVVKTSVAHRVPTAAWQDVSLPLALALQPAAVAEPAGANQTANPLTSASVEQTEHGTEAPATIVASFDGLGEGFVGPQGTARFRNPSDNSLAVGPDHIVQTVNTRMAVFTKKGSRFAETGRVLYGPMPTGNVFRGFGNFGAVNNGDAVVRYDQLADRWLIVMPLFRRIEPRADDPLAGKSGEPAQRSVSAVAGQPGAAEPLYQPAAGEAAGGEEERRRRPRGQRDARGCCAIFYAVSSTPDPLGPYYRYAFLRPLFPDYPRPGT